MPIYKEGGKKDGLQCYRVVVSYTDRAGAHHQAVRRAYGRDAALQIEGALRREYADAPAQVRMTVAELAERYLDAKRGEVRETTWDRLRREIEYNITPQLGETRIDKLTPQVLEAWKKSVAARGIAVSTCRNAYRDLAGMLNYAVRVDYLSVSPLKKVSNFRDTGEVVRDGLHYYTPEQFTQYMDAARDAAEASGDWRYYVFFAVAFYAGLRKGENNALRWSDIEGNVIHVRRSVSQKLRTGDVETRPKTQSSIRDIQAPSPLMAILDAQRARQERDPSFSVEWRVCGGAEVIRDTSLEKANISFARAAGLPHIRIHDFRHSHASVLCNHGVNIQEVARRLGHSDVKVTWSTYSHLYPREEERAVAVLDEIHVRSV